MMDLSTAKGRAVAAAMRLAERKAWRDVSMLDIADESGIQLAGVFKEFSSKTQVLAAFARMADEAVLRRIERREANESPRERLFDVLMTRFELMLPYRAALKQIVASRMFAPELLRTFMTSQQWMLAAAGVPSDGLSGALRGTGLASVYARVFQVWLEDDDPGLARTMAVLDRRLRGGENWVRRFDEALATGEKFVDSLRSRRRSKSGSKSGPAPDFTTGTTASGPAAGDEPPPSSVH